jgi:hypothetical protein
VSHKCRCATDLRLRTGRAPCDAAGLRLQLWVWCVVALLGSEDVVSDDLDLADGCTAGEDVAV